MDDVDTAAIHIRVRDESTFANVIGEARVPLCGLNAAGSGATAGAGANVEGASDDLAAASSTGALWYNVYDSSSTLRVGVLPPPTLITSPRHQTLPLLRACHGSRATGHGLPS